jgi:hypothetical protein
MTRCSSCGADGTGNFCARCGGALSPARCASCGTEAAPGARFCTGCGNALGSAGAAAAGAAASGAGAAGSAAAGSARSGLGTSALVGWGIAGLFLVGLIVFIALPVLSPSGSSVAGPAGGGGAGPGPAPNVDLSAMTPREAADRLYTRVMQGVTARDTAEILNFLPMAIAAYDRARPLDADGHFHVSLLHRTGLDFEQALVEALAGLEQYPDHILNLSAAAEASAELGDTASARLHFARLLEVYDAEAQRDIDDYVSHAVLLPQMRNEARAFLEGSGGA